MLHSRVVSKGLRQECVLKISRDITPSNILWGYSFKALTSDVVIGNT